jgi:TATA-box binding protein (TBP) (component of TFIID and TFIIIB)
MIKGLDYIKNYTITTTMQNGTIYYDTENDNLISLGKLYYYLNLSPRIAGIEYIPKFGNEIVHLSRGIPSNCTDRRRYINHQPANKKQKRGFKNSLSIVIRLNPESDIRIANIKISNNGSFQVSGCRTQLDIDIVLQILEIIFTKHKYRSLFMQPAKALNEVSVKILNTNMKLAKIDIKLPPKHFVSFDNTNFCINEKYAKTRQITSILSKEKIAAVQIKYYYNEEYIISAETDEGSYTSFVNVIDDRKGKLYRKLIGDNKLISIQLFANGRVMITGCKLDKHLRHALEIINTIIAENYDQVIQPYGQIIAKPEGYVSDDEPEIKIRKKRRSYIRTKKF